MTLPAFALARPDTVDEALDLISEDRVPYCGGTELLLAMKVGLQRPEVLVDLKRVPDLNRISRTAAGIEIGSTATHADVSENQLVREVLPMLASVEHRVGNMRVRAQGSVGGNLCFAEPRSDLATALIALDASVTLATVRGRRTIPLRDFIVGPYYSEREPDELLLYVSIPVVDGRRGNYEKFQVTERPTVGIAVVEDGADGAVRIVIGAAAEVPLVHDFARMSAVDVDLLIGELDPVPDLTGSADYKRHVTGVYLRRTIAALVGGHGG